MRTIILAILVLPSVLLSTLFAEYYSSAVVVEIIDLIDGGTVSLVQRAVESIPPGGILVLYVNSYGGYLASADSIAGLLVNRGVNCAVYIPPGGKAVSAAALISITCGRIYMAPGSVIGAARPYPDDPKTVSYVASRFRSLARRVYANETIEEVVVRFVTEALTLTDEEAIYYGIARRAGSLGEVLRELGAPEPGHVLSKDIWDKVLSVISDPLVYSIAITIGTFLIIAEILVTGFQGYVIAGVLLIAIALYGMNIIPPDLLVLAMMISGSVLVLVELMTPGFGAFGVSGLVLLAIGLYMTVRGRPIPHVIEPTVLGMAVALSMVGLFFGFIIYKAGQAMRLRKPKLREKLVGSIGIAKTDVSPTTPGVVYILGEEWSAYSVSNTIVAGSKVIVRDVKGLFLYVEKTE